MTLIARSFPVESHVRIELCGESDVEQLMKFLHENWAKNHILSRDVALLRWQYDAALRCGQAGAPTVLVAWRDNEIVGMLGLTWMRWLQHGSTHTGAWSSHWFVLPELRTSPLALRLIRQVSQLGIEVLGTVGTNAQSASILRFSGYDFVPEIPRWVGVVNPASAATLLHASGIPESEHDELMSYCQERALPMKGACDRAEEWEVVEWSDDTATAWDACWQRSLAQTFVGVARDSAYLEWRYVRHPRFRYRIWLARHRGSGLVGGLLVSRVEVVRGRTEQVGRICDFLVEATPPAHCLLRRLVGDACVTSTAFIDFYCSKPIDGLAEAGFRVEQLGTDPFSMPSRLQPLEQGGRPLNAAVRLPAALRGSLGALMAQGALYLTKSDGDQDRPN